MVFTVAGNVSLAFLRFRGEGKPLLSCLVQNFAWAPFLTIFIGGLSLHVSQAILSHLCSIDMSWGATAKELENTTFWKELAKVGRKFKFTFMFCALMSAVMIVLAVALPDSLETWRITQVSTIFPLAMLVAGHALCPIVLNPSLMLFTW